MSVAVELKAARDDDIRDRGSGRTARVADRAHLIGRLRGDGDVIGAFGCNVTSNANGPLFETERCRRRCPAVPAFRKARDAAADRFRQGDSDGSGWLPPPPPEDQRADDQRRECVPHREARQAGSGVNGLRHTLGFEFKMSVTASWPHAGCLRAEQGTTDLRNKPSRQVGNG